MLASIGAFGTIEADGFNSNRLKLPYFLLDSGVVDKFFLPAHVVVYCRQ